MVKSKEWVLKGLVEEAEGRFEGLLDWYETHADATLAEIEEQVGKMRKELMGKVISLRQGISAGWCKVRGVWGGDEVSGIREECSDGGGGGKGFEGILLLPPLQEGDFPPWIGC